MYFKYTNGQDNDFLFLCGELDRYLNELVGGEKNRSQYLPFNQPNGIHTAIVMYDEENKPAGCAGFKHYDSECAEIKRVFISPEYRGKGLSKQCWNRLQESRAIPILYWKPGRPWPQQ